MFCKRLFIKFCFTFLKPKIWATIQWLRFNHIIIIPRLNVEEASEVSPFNCRSKDNDIILNIQSNHERKEFPFVHGKCHVA